LTDVLSTLQVTREQLVDMSVLIGTDFNDGIKGIGPKKALALIKKYGRLEELPKDGKVPVPDEYQDIRRIFLEPEVTDDYALRWESVNPESVKKILCDKHAFSVDRIDAVLSRIVSKDAARSQKNLDSWA
jgi:flap endonuclease-1